MEAGSGTDLETEMDGVNASVFLRVPFTVSDSTAVSSLLMRMRWDDGFVAYINGVQVAADRHPRFLAMELFGDHHTE